MKFQIYKAADGWRWRTVARNHKIRSDSGEAYSTRSNAKRAVRDYITDIHQGRFSIEVTS